MSATYVSTTISSPIITPSKFSANTMTTVNATTIRVRFLTHIYTYSLLLLFQTSYINELAAQGQRAVQILGDGICLFRALELIM